MLRFISLLSLLALACAVHAQTPYPPTCVQDVTWSNGDHPLTISNAIHAPCSPSMPVSIQASATAELVSGTEVHLQNGFHAGDFDAEGRFRARIQQELEPLLLLSPEVDGHVVDNVLHVNKWEKLELGVILPQLYQDAIDNFFQHYYTNGPLASATPNMLDPAHDLNPYADDSLQLVMTLTKPSGTRTLKWGFFMREAGWSGPEDWAILVEDDEDPLAHCNVRFRVAPDEEGLWSFTISIQAPHTVSAIGDPLPHVQYSAHTFMCDPPLPDNHGPLRVNPVNRRMLQFEDGTSFFGMGTNLADTRGGPAYADIPVESREHSFYKLQHELMLDAMEQLHGAGGNFFRMFLLEKLFTPEYVNLGVYDQYRSEPACANGNGRRFRGNCQYQCWAFDQIVEQARAENIYLQVCIDPYPPIKSYEDLGWGSNPYWLNFFENKEPQTPPANRYDMEEFFFTPHPITGQPMLDKGVFYYWKRKYKYILSRWGYSVNVPIIEPFNEIDQMLSYSTDTTGGNCSENDGLWNADPGLPLTLDQWLTDIIGYVRGEPDVDHAETSPLGEDKKLFLMSYAGGPAPGVTEAEYYQPLTNSKVDLIDLHKGIQWQWDVRAGFDDAQHFHNTFTSGNKKPFHQGEFSTYAYKSIPVGMGIQNKNTYPYFANYGISFHNELWASSFFGSFATGTSWCWERVFWWPNALDPPLPDLLNNPAQLLTPPSSVLGQPNVMTIPGFGTLPVTNRTLHHHFRPLSDLLNHPNWSGYNFFGGDFSVHKHSSLDEANKIECYWLLREPEKDLAIGWVHNMNAYWENSWYMKADAQNMLGCAEPSTQSITLEGFAIGNDYTVTYVPTWTDATDVPDGQSDIDHDSSVTLNLSSEPFIGTIGSFLDTLHSDYAFIIAIEPFVKSRRTDANTAEFGREDADFILFPNPAHDEVCLRFPDDVERNILIHDLTGRKIMRWQNVRGPSSLISLRAILPGPYFVTVENNGKRSSKKLIIY